MGKLEVASLVLILQVKDTQPSTQLIAIGVAARFQVYTTRLAGLTEITLHGLIVKNEQRDLPTQGNCTPTSG